MTRRALETSFVVCVAAIVVLLPATAKAQTPSLEAVSRASDVVVVGRVVSARAQPAGPGGLAGIHTRIQLEVKRTVVGPERAALDLWVQGGVVGDRARVVTGQARFSPGEEVVVFLYRNAAGALWPSSFGAAKWRVSRSGSGTWVVPAPVQRLVRTAVDRDRISVRPILLEDLVRRIRAARGER